MRIAAKYRNELSLLVAIVAVFCFTLALNQDYLHQPGLNLRDILHQTALLGIFSLGAAIVIIAGGIDLSSGSVIVFCGSVCALVMMALAPKVNGVPDVSDVGKGIVALSIVASVAVGMMIGTLHTWLITVVRLPPFVATLASLVGLRSLAKVLNPAITTELGSQVGTVRADDATFEMLSRWWVALVVFLALSAACHVLLNHTVWGRHLYALGGNEEAARLSGIRTDRLKWLAYSLGAMTAAIAGVLYVAKIGSANPATLGIGYELNAIAAAVVGGCSLRGGVGTIPGVMLGVLFLQMVIDSVNKVIKVGSDDFQGMIVGLLVVLAVALNEFRRQSGGRRMAFFPGALGVAVIPILGLMAGTVVFVTSGMTAGIVTFVSVTFLLGAWKLFQGRGAH